MRAITFCTPEFEKYAAPWEAQMRAAGFDPTVVRRPSRGQWGLNTNMKPSAVLEAWDGTPAVYTDIDASVDPSLVWPGGVFDVGIVDNPDTKHKNRIASAILFLNPRAVEFITFWSKLCAQKPGRLDHGLMTISIASLRQRLRFLDVTVQVAGKWAQNGISEEKVSLANKISQ